MFINSEKKQTILIIKYPFKCFVCIFVFFLRQKCQILFFFSFSFVFDLKLGQWEIIFQHSVAFYRQSN